MVWRADKLEQKFPVGSAWVHTNGRRYVVVGVANIANYNPKYRPVVVYRSESPTPLALLPQRLWTKSPTNFLRTMTRAHE